MAEEAGVVQIFGAFGCPLGLELAQLLEVLLELPMDALFIEGEQFQVLGVVAHRLGGGDGGVGFGMFGVVVVAGAIEMAHGDDVVALGAGVVETPGFFGDRTGEEDFHGADGGEVGHHFVAEGVVFDAIFFGHHGGLTGDAVAAGVLAGAPLAFDGAWAGGGLGVDAVGCELTF